VSASLGYGSPEVLVDDDVKEPPDVFLEVGKQPVLILTRQFLKSYSNSTIMEAAIAHEMGHIEIPAVSLRTRIELVRKGLEMGSERVMTVVTPILLVDIFLNTADFFSPSSAGPLVLYLFMTALVILLVLPAYVAGLAVLSLSPLLLVFANMINEMEVAADAKAVSFTSSDTVTTMLRNLKAEQDSLDTTDIARDFVKTIKRILSERWILQYVYKLPSLCLVAAYDCTLAHFLRVERRLAVLSNPYDVKPMGIRSLKPIGGFLFQTSVKDKYGRSGLLTGIIFWSIFLWISLGHDLVDLGLLAIFSLIIIPILLRCVGLVYETFKLFWSSS